VVTEIYADDGQLVGTFALQRRILMTWEQCPKVLYNAVTSPSKISISRITGASIFRASPARRGAIFCKHRITGGASTITMQLAGQRFSSIAATAASAANAGDACWRCRSSAATPSRRSLPCTANQVYLAHGNYGFAAASEFYFGKPVGDLNAAGSRAPGGHDPRAEIIRRCNPQRALWIAAISCSTAWSEEGKITETPKKKPRRKRRSACILQYPRNDLAPYFLEEIRKYLESTYGTEAVHERGLRVYTTLNVAMQRAANQAVRDGLHSYDRRHGWRGKLHNILARQSRHAGFLRGRRLAPWPLKKGELRHRLW
jgi:penicillin-binding protein 1A